VTKVKPSELLLDQLNRTLAKVGAVPARPRGGWLRAVRQALGMTTRQLAARVGVAQPTLVQAEKAEVEGRISLAQLRRIAAALECDVHYVLVPRTPLKVRVAAQAEAVARKRVAAVAHTMALEAQGTGARFKRAQVRQVARELATGRRARLWD